MPETVFYTSVLVSGQDKALDFYTNVLGLEKRVVVRAFRRPPLRSRPAAPDCGARAPRLDVGQRLGERRGWDSNPRDRGYRPNGFQDRRIRPLCHPSGLSSLETRCLTMSLDLKRAPEPRSFPVRVGEAPAVWCHLVAP